MKNNKIEKQHLKKKINSFGHIFNYVAYSTYIISVRLQIGFANEI